ncbi:ribose-5-phosphate isomerase A [Candidatus Vidania fulgoroideorum]
MIRISNILLDILKLIKKKDKKIFAFGSGFFTEYFIKNFIKESGVKNILLTSKKKIFKKLNYSNYNKIDYYIGFSNEVYSDFFIKGHNGMIYKEKILYKNAKKRIVISDKFLKNCSILRIPVEILPSTFEYIKEKNKNLCKIEKLNLNKKVFITEDNTNISLMYIKKNNIKKIKGPIGIGYYKKIKNTKYILYNDKKVFIK